MSTAIIVDAIKRRLRAQGITYLALARRLKLSEPTVKRDLARGDFSLKRLDQICEVLGVTVAELANEEPARELRITRFTDAQERALTSDPKLVPLTYLLVNRWSLDEITDAIELSENDLVKALLALDEIGIVKFRPPRSVQLLTARNFAWRNDGPVHTFFLERVVPDYFRTKFDAPGDDFYFVQGRCRRHRRRDSSPRSIASRRNSRSWRDRCTMPVSERHGCTAILALRDWRFRVRAVSAEKGAEAKLRLKKLSRLTT